MASLSFRPSPRTFEISCLGPPRHDYFRAGLISCEPNVPPTETAFRAADVRDRMGMQFVPAWCELASEVRHEILHVQAAFLQVGDRGENEGRRVAPGLRQQLLGRELRVGGFGHGRFPLCSWRLGPPVLGSRTP